MTACILKESNYKQYINYILNFLKSEYNNFDITNIATFSDEENLGDADCFESITSMIRMSNNNQYCFIFIKFKEYEHIENIEFVSNTEEIINYYNYIDINIIFKSLGIEMRFSSPTEELIKEECVYKELDNIFKIIKNTLNTLALNAILQNISSGGERKEW